MLEKIVSQVNGIVWNPVLVVLLIAAGLYFSFRTRFVQVRRFRLMLKSLFSKKEGAQGIWSFEAFCIGKTVAWRALSLGWPHDDGP